jgi:hypothetical protein
MFLTAVHASPDNHPGDFEKTGAVLTFTFFWKQDHMLSATASGLRLSR